MGADYLSSNGGGYVFSTPSGCKKATEINTSSCSRQEAVDAALCRNTNTDCFRQVSGQILGRFLSLKMKEFFNKYKYI